MSKKKKEESKDGKKNTSLRLEAKTLKELKLRALEEDTSIQKIMEKLVKEYLKSKK